MPQAVTLQSSNGLCKTLSFARHPSSVAHVKGEKSGIQYPLAQVLEDFKEASDSVFNRS